MYFKLLHQILLYKILSEMTNSILLKNERIKFDNDNFEMNSSQVSSPFPNVFPIDEVDVVPFDRILRDQLDDQAGRGSLAIKFKDSNVRICLG